MPDSDLSIGRAASGKADVVLESVCSCFTGADVSIAHHGLSFEYICGCVFVRERALDSIGSVVVCVAGEVLSPEDSGSACCGGQRY